MTFLSGIAHVTEPPDAHYYPGQRNGSLPWTLDRFMRRRGQPNEQCFDAVQIDPTRAIAYFTRIGYGDDKIVHLRAGALKPGVPHRVASALDDVAFWGVYDADRVERIEDPKDRWSPSYRYFTDYAEMSSDGTVLPKKAGPVVVVARSSSGVREFIPFTVETNCGCAENSTAQRSQ